MQRACKGHAWKRGNNIINPKLVQEARQKQKMAAGGSTEYDQFWESKHVGHTRLYHAPPLFFYTLQ